MDTNLTADTPSAGSGTLAPPAGAMASTDSDPPVFALFTKDWLQLQTYIVQALQLPITQTDFTSKYGTFSDTGQVQDVVSAMKAVQGLSETFGDPTTLFTQLKNDPSIFETTTPPKQLYANVVWTANQIYNAANTFNETLGSFEELLEPANCGSTANCAAILKEVLTGAGGLQSTAVSATATVNQLIVALSGFNEDMKKPNATIQQYTNNSSQFLTDAQNAAGQDLKDVMAFQEDGDKAYRQWQDYTTSAVTVSVGIVVVTAGMAWPAAAVTAGVLGHEAVEARDKYNAYCAERNQAAADEQKKHQLVADLSGLNSAVGSVGEAAGKFIVTLQQVAAAWVSVGSSLSYIVDTYTPEQLSSYSWINKALKCEDATKDWQRIATAAHGYTSKSLVPFNLHQFGQPLPVS